LSYLLLENRQAERVRTVAVRFSTTKPVKKPKNYRHYERNTKNVQEIHFNWSKWILSFFLVAFIFVTYQYNYPYAQVARGWIQDSITREYNFNGALNWYQQKFSGNPAILPTFSIKQKEVNSQFVKPFDKSMKSMKPLSQGVVIEFAQPDNILSVEQGLVVSIKEEQNLGQTVIIRHRNGIESIYGMLDQLKVEENDWLQTGQSIGMANQKLYFAIRDQSKYVNPMDVIAFEGQN